MPKIQGSNFASFIQKKTTIFDMKRKCVAYRSKKKISMFNIKKSHIIFSPAHFLHELAHTQTMRRMTQFLGNFGYSQNTFYSINFELWQILSYYICIEEANLKDIMRWWVMCMGLWGSFVLYVVNAWMSEISIRSIYLNDI